MRIIIVLFIFSLFISISGCDIINPSETIPSYIHIDSFVLKGNYDSVGSLSHNITDVWVIIDNEFIGAFELPVTFPVLKAGSHKITLKAGIKENGISNTRLPYPFYDGYVKTIDLESDKTDTIRPVIRYIPDSYKMPINEDFENPVYVFSKSSVSTVNFETSTKGRFEGNYSLYSTLTSLNDLIQIESTELYQLPRNKTVFMELNYKSSIMLKVGYYAVTSAATTQHLVLNLNPAKTWRKVYINYGGEINYESSSAVFRFFIGGLKQTESYTSVVQLDNIKVFYLE